MSGYTDDELKEFDRLLDRFDRSQDQFERITALAKFMTAHGETKCDAMFAELMKRHGKRT